METEILRPGQLSSIKGEPHVFDLHLAANLGFSNVYEIRRIIVRNFEELEMHGPVSVTVTKTSSKGGRPGKAYYLNEGQALVLCALSKTAKAAQVRKLLIDVFMAWRTGKTVPVRKHFRRPPALSQTTGFQLTCHDDGIATINMQVPLAYAISVFSNYQTHFHTT